MLILTSRYCGFEVLFTLTSQCTVSSYRSSFSITTSPERRNPKKHIDTAAHSIVALSRSVSLSHTFFGTLNISGVIGSLVCLCLVAFFLLSPFITNSIWSIPPTFRSPKAQGYFSVPGYRHVTFYCSCL